MRLPLVSIVVPIYNQEQYLKKCIESLRNQTYENVEIVLVNDGSLDCSLQICLHFAEQDERCRIINKENGGLSSARNAGVDVATGEYITFVDSDDYLEPEAICQMVEGALEQSADVICMNWYSVNSDYTEKVKSNLIKKELLGKVISGRDYLKGVCKRELSDSVCAKLFKREKMQKYKFSTGKLNEDFLLLSEMMMKEQMQIGFVEYFGYCYYVREGSISRSGFGQSSIDAVHNAYNMQELAAKEAPELEKFYGAYVLYQARTALILISREDGKKHKEIEKECIELVRKNAHYMRDSFLSIKDKVFCFGVIYAPHFVMKIRRRFRRRVGKSY